MAISPLHGVLAGRLQESHPGQIVVGGLTFFLPDGEPCRAKIGEAVEVFFREQGGRREVTKIITRYSDSLS
jgi:hypothetical protein